MANTTMEKKSLTLPADLVAQAQARTGARGLSSYVARALATQLELDLLADYVAQARALNGNVDGETAAQLAADVAAADAAVGHQR